MSNMTDPPFEDKNWSPQVPVPLPDLGTAGETVRVSAWFVEPGDEVDAGDPLVEVVIPGMTADVCSPVSGRVSRLVKGIDAIVRSGDIVAWVECAT